jgi:putative peptidoglycan lipid II flippase
VSDLETPANRQIARAAGMVMAAFVVSNLTGLARQILVSKFFGTSMEMDAFSAANRVSETLFYLMAGGALSSAFIPTFTGLLTKGKRKDAWVLASAVANLVVLALILVSILVAIFALPIVRYVLAPGFSVNPIQEALTVDLLRLMLPSAVMFGLAGLAAGVLNSHQVFWVPAFMPAMYQAGMIFGVLVLAPKMGIYGLGWGVVIGAALYLLLQLPSLWSLRGQYFPTFARHLAELREVAVLMLPRLFGVAVVQLNFWVNIRLASSMPEGSAAAITLALALMLMPQAAIAQSIAIAAMPTLSAQYALGKLDDMRSSLASSLRWALLLSIPASLGLILLRFPIITLLYQRGEFDEHSTELVAWALLWYTAGLVGHSLVEVLSRAFYALHDTRTPVLVGSVAMGLNVLLSLVFSQLFQKLGWMPHGGLALANSLATALESVGLIFFMRRRLGSLQGLFILKATGQAVLAALVMWAVVWTWMDYMRLETAWLVTTGGVALGALAYGLVAWVVGVTEFRRLAAYVFRRLGIGI